MFAVNLLYLGFKLVGATLLPYLLVRHSRYLRGVVPGRSLAIGWLSFVALLLVPVDLSLANCPGSPHFIPVACGGDFSFEGLRAANAGEFMIDGLLGACSALPYEPWLGRATRRAAERVRYAAGYADDDESLR